MEISIIIPCFNIAAHLSKCIESVLQQTYSHFELLLLDDGSIDDTFAICQKYQRIDSRVRVFQHDNKGVSYTRNRGILEAKGLYLLFVDGDDWIEKKMIENLFAKFTTSGNVPICGTINHRGAAVAKNESFKKLLVKQKSQQVTSIDLLQFETLGSPCARLYDKKIIVNNNIIFDEKVSYQEDLLFNIRYYEYTNGYTIIDYFGYHYVEHQNSSSRRFHKNFNHLHYVYQSLKNKCISAEDQQVLQEFLIQSSLKKLATIFHKDSVKNKKEKVLEINELLTSDYYTYSRKTIAHSGVNKVLVLLLKNRYTTLVYWYYKLLHS